MSGNNLLLDTNIILYFLGGDETLIPLLEGKQLYLSFISEIELFSYSGLSDAEIRNIKKFVKECIIVDIPNSVKEIAIAIRKSRSIRLPDALIAATAIFLNVSLVTADSDFKRLEEVDIIYYEFL